MNHNDQTLDERGDRRIPSVARKTPAQRNAIYIIFLAIAAFLLIVFLGKAEDASQTEASDTIDEYYGTGVAPLPNSYRATQDEQGIPQRYRTPSDGYPTPPGVGKVPRADHAQAVVQSPASLPDREHEHSAQKLTVDASLVPHPPSQNHAAMTEEERWERRKANPVFFERGGGSGQRQAPQGGLDGEIAQLNRELEAISGLGTSGSMGSFPGKWPADRPPEARNHNDRFAQQVNSQMVETASAMPIGDLQYKIIQGKIISATLETAIDSSLPGMVRAVVSNDIYGEAGREVLVPRGSRLVGQYNSAIQNGQYRVFIVWSRLIRPDGIDINIGSTGTDALGRAGSVGDVDSRFWTRFGNATLLSMLGAVTSTYGADPDDQLTASNAYRQSIANSFAGQANADLRENISVSDVIHLDQGEKIKIMVAKDLDFSIVMKSQGYRQ